MKTIRQIARETAAMTPMGRGRPSPYSGWPTSDNSREGLPVGKTSVQVGDRVKLAGEKDTHTVISTQTTGHIRVMNENTGMSPTVHISQVTKVKKTGGGAPGDQPRDDHGRWVKV